MAIRKKSSSAKKSGKNVADVKKKVRKTEIKTKIKTKTETETKGRAKGKPKSQSKLTITEQVEKVLDTLRPYLISDGGNIELLGVDETNGIVTVHLVGACASCSSAQVTLYAGVEKTIKEKIPQINALIAV
jgi:Fe-S cluster biogenesis protein NfuA